MLMDALSEAEAEAAAAAEEAKEATARAERGEEAAAAAAEEAAVAHAHAVAVREAAATAIAEATRAMELMVEQVRDGARSGGHSGRAALACGLGLGVHRSLRSVRSPASGRRRRIVRQTPRRDIFDFGFDSQWRRQGVWKRCRTNTGPNEHLEGNRNVAKNATRAVECFWGGGVG